MGIEDELKTWREQISRRAEAMEAASIESANQALRALLLLNGGACIALLGFLSSTFDVSDNPNAAILGWSIITALRWFGSGAGLAVAAACVAYLTNSAYARGLRDGGQRAWTAGARLNHVAVVAGLASLICFCVGLFRIGNIYL